MIIKLFERTESEPEPVEPSFEDPLLSAILQPERVTKAQSMSIPAFESAVDTVAGTVATLPIKLFRRKPDRIEEVVGDRRVELLNGDTGDTLTASEMKRAVVEDYFADKGGYVYINRVGNDVRSLHYVEPAHVSILKSADPIFKAYKIMVNGREYYPFQFLRVLRSTKDGMRGASVVEKSNELLATAHATMVYERALVQRGGNKRGFVKSAKKLGDDALKKLKRAWRQFYGNNEDNVIVLNDGVDFQEASNTSVEMQLNENKMTNGNDIYSLFKLPPAIIRGGATENDRDNYIRYCVMPFLADFTAALNRDLLLESEKDELFFDFDLTEYMKANMKERWAAWANAKKNGLVNADEFRRSENMTPLGINYINMGLQDVLLDPVAQKIIVPNMGQVIDLANMEPTATQLKGGDAIGDQAAQ